MVCDLTWYVMYDMIPCKLSVQPINPSIIQKTSTSTEHHQVDNGKFSPSLTIQNSIASVIIIISRVTSRD